MAMLSMECRNLDEETIEKVDRMLGRAINSVAKGEVTKATVALQFDVQANDDEDAESDWVVTVTHKHAGSSKTEYTPACGQMRISFSVPGQDEGEAAR